GCLWPLHAGAPATAWRGPRLPVGWKQRHEGLIGVDQVHPSSANSPRPEAQPGAYGQRSVDGGRHWRVVLAPSVSHPDQSAGLYYNARYADVGFLAVDPYPANGLHRGTVGAPRDVLSGGAVGP